MTNVNWTLKMNVWNWGEKIYSTIFPSWALNAWVLDGFSMRKNRQLHCRSIAKWTAQILFKGFSPQNFGWSYKKREREHQLQKIIAKEYKEATGRNFKESNLSTIHVPIFSESDSVGYSSLNCILHFLFLVCSALSDFGRKVGSRMFQ